MAGGQGRKEELLCLGNFLSPGQETKVNDAWHACFSGNKGGFRRPSEPGKGLQKQRHASFKELGCRAGWVRKIRGEILSKPERQRHRKERKKAEAQTGVIEVEK